MLAGDSYVTGDPPGIRWQMGGHRAGSGRAYAYLIGEIILGRDAMSLIVDSDPGAAEQVRSLDRALDFMLDAARDAGLLDAAEVARLRSADATIARQTLRRVWDLDDCRSCRYCLGSSQTRD